MQKLFDENMKMRGQELAALQDAIKVLEGEVRELEIKVGEVCRRVVGFSVMNFNSSEFS